MSARRLPLWVGWLLALVVAAMCASLGTWQLQRMHLKQAQLDSAARVLDQRRVGPLALAAQAERARGYDWVAGKGQFAATPAILLDNQNRDSRPGVRAYRLFLAEGTNMPLLVELGWLPLPGDRRLPEVPRPDVDRVSGLLLPPPAAGLVEAAPQLQPNGQLLVAALKPELLAEPLGLSRLPPRVLRLDPALGFGYARDLELLPNTLPPDRHLGYAVQWFALAAAVVVIALVLTLRERRKRVG